MNKNETPTKYELSRNEKNTVCNIRRVDPTWVCLSVFLHGVADFETCLSGPWNNPHSQRLSALDRLEPKPRTFAPRCF